ncbi:MAG: hypothetical protein ACRDQY_25025 [Pseudonocardiaceae bacterium]
MGLSAAGAAAPRTARAVLGFRPFAGGAVPSPSGAGPTFGAQLVCLGVGTARASGFLAVHRSGQAVGRVAHAGGGGVVGLRLVVVGSVHGCLLLSVSTRPDSAI